MSSFENLRVVDNFYQTSLFFPMPTVVISTLCEDGSTTLGPYSLVQPYYVAGKDYYAMLLSCRNSSNTAQNILRTGKCAINFVDDKPRTFAECVKLSWPGDKPEDKMPGCKFKLEKGQAEGERPMVLTDAIINGVKASDFPNLPVDYGYRDSKNFWFHRKTRMRAELLPIRKQSLESVRYAADRADDKVKFTDDALETILNVPRVFLPLVLKGCVEWARENNCQLITAAEMKIINDKRSKEKNKK